MPLFFTRHPALAGLDRASRRDVRRIAWYFAQRHWSVHAPAFVWIVFVLLHTRYQIVPERRDYLLITLAIFVLAVINIRLHIARYLKPARAVFDTLGSTAARTITGR
ncbi:hypothetical protein BTHE68_38890 [Burkholderia sp. THE68]|jgi:hypothetical protein|uniref:hypothetical protein n=1 Tax=Burkholderia sp. THE68 TaxID=758782 RepID=UPI001317D717|nr:hypothetical protein [Burkholderia sp. THE68]BBU30155.1 hypothetical protein BTHE68_38890 [Burkholderia sp. THE68]